MTNEARNIIVKTLRIKPEDLQKINSLAAQSNMSFNAYVIKCAMEPCHSEYTPEFLCYLRDISTILATHDCMLTDEMKKRLILKADYICKTLSNS